MAKGKNLHAALFSVPGILFLISGIRLHLGGDAIGMLIHSIAGVCFLIIAYSRLKGWFS